MVETYFCEVCGSTRIHCSADVRWDCLKEEWIVIAIYDDDWCMACRERDGSDGRSAFGTLPEKGTERHEAEAPTAQDEADQLATQSESSHGC